VFACDSRAGLVLSAEALLGGTWDYEIENTYKMLTAEADAAAEDRLFFTTRLPYKTFKGNYSELDTKLKSFLENNLDDEAREAVFENLEHDDLIANRYNVTTGHQTHIDDFISVN